MCIMWEDVQDVSFSSSQTSLKLCIIRKSDPLVDKTRRVSNGTSYDGHQICLDKIQVIFVSVNGTVHFFIFYTPSYADFNSLEESIKVLVSKNAWFKRYLNFVKLWVYDELHKIKVTISFELVVFPPKYLYTFL